MNLWFDDNHILDDPERYRRLIRKLIYLTVTRSDITFVAGVLSRFMHQSREIYWLAVMRFYLTSKDVQENGWCIGNMNMYTFLDILIQGYAGDRGDKKSTTGYCTFVRENMVTWRSKNKMCLAQVLKLSIELWLIRHARRCG